MKQATIVPSHWPKAKMGKVTAFSCISKYNITENSLKVHKYFHREILFSFHRMFAVTQNIQKMCVSQIEKSETPSSLLKNVASIESQFLTKVTSEKKPTPDCFASKFPVSKKYQVLTKFAKIGKFTILTFSSAILKTWTWSPGMKKCIVHQTQTNLSDLQAQEGTLWYVNNQHQGNLTISIINMCKRKPHQHHYHGDSPPSTSSSYSSPESPTSSNHLL